MADEKENGTEEAAINVALLRGINVGGKNKLPMKDLATMFAEAGCEEVQTYIQSGNVVFRAEPSLADRIPELISEAILSRFGYRVPLIIRTGDDIREVADANPFVRAGAETDKLHVVFLADLPDAAEVDTLDPNRSPPDEFAARGREIYLHCPEGLARTKLTNSYFDSKLTTISTVRNWKTVLKLLELATG